MSIVWLDERGIVDFIFDAFQVGTRLGKKGWRNIQSGACGKLVLRAFIQNSFDDLCRRQHEIKKLAEPFTMTRNEKHERIRRRKQNSGAR